MSGASVEVNQNYVHTECLLLYSSITMNQRFYMSEQKNENSVLGADGKVRKEWKKPVIVELEEANGDGAEGGKRASPIEVTFLFTYGPS